MTKKRFLIYFTLILMILAFSTLKSIKNNVTEADSGDVYVALEASADSGATWYNYAGTDNPGEESLNVNPGDTVLIRIRVWNANAGAYNVAGNGTITNSEYISEADLISLDTDANTNEFSGYFFGDSGLGEIIITGNTAEEDAEITTFSITLSEDFPVGESTIEGTVHITTAELYVTQNPFQVFADDIKISTFRLVVTQDELPETGANLY